MKLRVSLALVMGLTLLGPAVGTSETRPDVLYELTEHAILQDALRLATSSLESSARRGTPLCPERLLPVLPNERALGDPTVRVEVDFD